MMDDKRLEAEKQVLASKLPSNSYRFMRVCQKFKTTLYINQTRNLSESHLSCEFSLFLIFKYSEMPPKAFYKAKTDANMV